MLGHTFGLYYAFPNRKNPVFIVESSSDSYSYFFITYDKDGKEQIMGWPAHQIHDLSNEIDDKVDVNIRFAISKYREFGKEKWPNLFK